MVAWRRRLNPRVVQCPRQGFVWTERKRFNAPRDELPGHLPAETGPCGKRICSSRAGAVLQISPAIGDLAALPHAAGSFGWSAEGQGRLRLDCRAIISIYYFYSWRVGCGCRGGIWGLDGESGRTGCGGREGSAVRLRLSIHLRRSAPCCRSIGKIGSWAVTTCVCMRQSWHAGS